MTETKLKNKAVFFDRDGVLNHLVKRDGSFYSPQKFEDFYIIDDAIEVVDCVRKMGYLAIVISNQPDISRGKLKQSELDKMTQLLTDKTNIDDIFYCTHDDSNQCNCRKPAPGLFIMAQRKYNLDFDKSFMIGDTWKDVAAAENADIPIILLDRRYNQTLNGIKRINNLKESILLIDHGSIHEKS